MKKLFTCVLCLLLLLATVVSCAKTPSSGEDTLPTGTKEPETARITSDLPDMTWDGETFMMLHWFVDGWTIHGTDLYAEELNSDPINDEVFNRNSRLSERYDVEFELDELDYNEMVSKIRTWMNSNEDVYDLIGIRIADAPRIMLEGSLLDFNCDLPYVDLDKPYWDQSVREMLSFGGALFLMTSDTTISDKNATAAVAFNKVLAADLQLPNLYDLVRSGDWTMDQMLDLMDSYNADLNGDGEINPEDDIAGFLGADDVMMAFFMGGGGHFTVRDEYNYPELDFNIEENYDILDTIFDIMYHERFINFWEKRNELPEGPGYYFLGTHGVFNWLRMEDVIKMRGMEGDDFGILPTPKYSEEQPEYLSLLSKHGATSQGVLRCETDPEFVSFMLEAMAAESHYELQNAYYDVTLKTKSTRDDESQDMLDIIFKNRVIDIVEVGEFGGFPDHFLRFCSNHHGRDMASAYASYESKIQQDMEDFLDKIDALM